MGEKPTGGGATGSTRSAILHLAEEGVLTSHRAHALADGADVGAVEIVQARMALEGLTARRAAENITPSAARELTSILRRLRRSIDRGDLLDASDANTALHREITEISRHTVAQVLIAELTSSELRTRCRTIFVAGRPAASLEEHAAVVDAVVSGDADRAERAMRKHLENVCEALRNVRSDARPGTS